MGKIIEKLIGSIEDKKEYKLYRKKVKALPEEYRTAMQGIEKYMMNFGNGSQQFMKTLYGVFDLFEEKAAEKRRVKDIIGDDIGAFCEEIFGANPEITWEYDYKNKVLSRIKNTH